MGKEEFPRTLSRLNSFTVTDILDRTLGLHLFLEGVLGNKIYRSLFYCYLTFSSENAKLLNKLDHSVSGGVPAPLCILI